ncbi:MAG: hypothetical protein FWD23_00645 [Oscillospiraceae bacterium]|nr:hypothetical protein [Oscillospiraceae bacterium]
MITKRDTTVGYHCPFCGMPVLNRINIFSMEGNLIKMKCVCGGSELCVQILKDQKYKITTPCILCPNPHTFTLSSAAFFQRELFSLSCKFTAVEICFIGKSNKVYEALRKNEEELIKTFSDANDLEKDADNLFFDDDEYDDDDYEDFDGEDDFWDDGDFDWDGLEYEKKEGFILHKNENFEPAEYAIEDIGDIKISSYQAIGQVLGVISRIYDKKKIFCKCRNFDGVLTISDKTVRVECKNCGSYRDIKAASVHDAEFLVESEQLYLDYDD